MKAGVLLMPRISVGMGSSNARDDLKEGEQLSAGTSFLTSGDTQEWSGGSAQETEPSLQSPAPSVDSLYSADQPPRPTPSSASSTDGSTQETGSLPPSQPDSSETATPKDPGQDTAQQEGEPQLSGHELMQLARQAYVDRQFDHADALINSAESAGGVQASELATARRYVARGRASSALGDPPSDTGPVSTGPSEGVPADGGYLAGA